MITLSGRRRSEMICSVVLPFHLDTTVRRRVFQDFGCRPHREGALSVIKHGGCGPTCAWSLSIDACPRLSSRAGAICLCEVETLGSRLFHVFVCSACLASKRAPFRREMVRRHGYVRRKGGWRSILVFRVEKVPTSEYMAIRRATPKGTHVGV